MSFLSSLNPFGSNSGNSSSSTSASQTDNSLNTGNDSLLNAGTINYTQTTTDAGAVNASLEAMRDVTSGAFLNNTINNVAALEAMGKTNDSALAAMGKTNESALSLAEKTVTGIIDAITLTAQQPSSSGGVAFAPASSQDNGIPREYLILAGLGLAALVIFSRTRK